MFTPKGKYKIGKVAFDVTDKKRKAIYSNDLQNNRKIKFQLWYPAEDTNGYKQVQWLQDGDVVAKGVSKMMGFPDFVLSHTSLVMSNLSKYFNITGKLEGRISGEIQQEFISNFFEKYLYNNPNRNVEEVSKQYNEV